MLKTVIVVWGFLLLLLFIFSFCFFVWLVFCPGQAGLVGWSIILNTKRWWVHFWVRKTAKAKLVTILVAHHFPGQEFRQGLIGMSVYDVWGPHRGWFKRLGNWLGWLDWCHMAQSSGFLSSPCDLSKSLAWVSSQIGDLRVAEFLPWQPATLQDKQQLLGPIKDTPGIVSAHFHQVYCPRQLRRPALTGEDGLTAS